MRFGTAAALALALLAAGCSAPSRERWLEALFDDPPRADADATAAAGPGKAVDAAREPAFAGSSHAPYGAGACQVCHDLAGSTSFPGGGGWPGREPDARRAAQSKQPASSGTARLRLPVDRLCGGCHDDLDAEALARTRRVVHGPIAAGDCVYCHDPHRSHHPHLLRRAEAGELCVSCHDQESAEKRCSDPEAATRSCIDCHDPHAAQRRGLLREGVH